VVRILVELRRNDTDMVEGAVTEEGSSTAQPFAGWLELLRLLEIAASRSDPEPG
jgi:hypothetical protein